jgi:hypothetical protein
VSVVIVRRRGEPGDAQALGHVDGADALEDALAQVVVLCDQAVLLGLLELMHAHVQILQGTKSRCKKTEMGANNVSQPCGCEGHESAPSTPNATYIALVGLADQRLLELAQGGGAVLHVLLQVSAEALALLLEMVDLAYK